MSVAGICEFVLGNTFPFVVFLCLMFLFSFISAAYYQLGLNPSELWLARAAYYFKIAEGFGFVTMIMYW